MLVSSKLIRPKVRTAISMQMKKYTFVKPSVIFL